MTRKNADITQLKEYYYIVHKDVLDEYYAGIRNVRNGGELKVVLPLKQVEVARMLNIDARTVRDYTDNGLLKTINGVRGYWARYDYPEVDRFIREYLRR